MMDGRNLFNLSPQILLKCWNILSIRKKE